MAKKRDYKAEYAAAKARAKRAGYASQREYRAARKEAGLKGGNVSPLRKSTKQRMYPNGMPPARGNLFKRAMSKIWSDKHSQSVRSGYNDSWSDEKVDLYYSAFVEEKEGSRRTKSKLKRDAIRDWLVPQWMDHLEWEQIYA